MNDAGFLTPALAGFLLVLLRAGALCMAAPLFGIKTAPRRTRIGLAFVLALAAFSGAGFPTFTGLATGGAGTLVGAALTETLIGLVAGLSAKFALEAAHAAGQLISVSMGLSYGSVVDPLHGSESTAIAELLSMLSLGALVMAGAHREAIVWLCRSIITVPPGAAVEVSTLAGAVVTQAIASTALAVRMSFPVLVAVTFGHISLGVIGRTAPQLNVASIGFSVTILAGGGALYMVAPAIAELAARTAAAAFTGGV